MTEPDRRAQQIAAAIEVMGWQPGAVDDYGNDIDALAGRIVDAVEAAPRTPADQVGAYERDLDRQIVDTFAAIHELTAGLSEPARRQLHHHLGRLEDRTADQAEARGYQQAIANLLDTAGYKRWHKQVYATTGVDHHRWNFNNRVTLADYLEAVAPDGATS